MVPESTGHSSSPSICHPTCSLTWGRLFSGICERLSNSHKCACDRERQRLCDCLCKTGPGVLGIKLSITAATVWRMNSVPAAVHLQTPSAASKPRDVPHIEGACVHPLVKTRGSVERSAWVERPWKFSPGKVPQVTSRVRSARTTQHSHDHKLTWKASLLAHQISQNLVNHLKAPPPRLFPLSSLPTRIIFLFSRHFLHSSPVPSKICLASSVTRLLSFPICEKVDASLNFPSSVYQLAFNQYSSVVI